MLGGDVLRIYGACSFGVDPKCKFDGTNEVAGQIDGVSSELLCISPTVFKTGRILIEISINGGTSFQYQAYFTAGNSNNFVFVSVCSCLRLDIEKM